MPTSTVAKLAQILAIAFCVSMIALLLYVLWPHAGALIGAVTLALSFYPLHHWIQRHLPRRRPSTHALLSTTLVVFLLVMPLMGMLWAAVGESPNWTPTLRGWQDTMTQWREGTIVDATPTMRNFRGWMQKTFAIQPGQLRRQVGQNVENFIGTITQLGSVVSAGLAQSLMELGLMIIALFFIFRDGPAMYRRFEDFLPFDERRKQDCKNRMRDIIIGVMRGWLLTAILQGVLAAVGYAIAGVQGWVIFGLATMLAGLVPFVGTALVWAPLALIKIMSGSAESGLFLFAWGFLVVSLIDNFLRPYLVGQRAHIPFFYLLFALLGGIELWGLKGVIIGPLIVALAPVVLDMFGRRYEIADMGDLAAPKKHSPSEQAADRVMVV